MEALPARPMTREERRRHVEPGRKATRTRLAYAVATTIAVDLAMSLVLFLVERGERASEIDGFGDALFWTTMQLLTISSSLRGPESTLGRLADVVLAVYALSFLALIVSVTVHRLHLQQYLEGKLPLQRALRGDRTES